MIQGVTYNAATPNARVAQGEQIDFADIAQKKANIEHTKAQTEKLKQPQEDKSAGKKKERIFGDLSKLDATGAIVPDQHIATEWIDNVWDAAIKGDLSDPNVEKDIYMKAAQIKYMLDKSKEIGEKVAAIRVKDSEGNMVGAKDVVSNIYEGDLPYQEQDATGNIVEKTINSKDVKTFEDYQKYLLAQTKRLSDPVKMFDTYNYVNSKDDFIKNAFTTEIPNSGGQTIKTIKTEDDKIKFGLQSLWNDKEDLRRMEEYNFKKAKKESPDQVLPSGKKLSEIKSANEYFVENYLPQLRQKDVTLEGGSSNGTSSSGNKVTYDKSSAYYDQTPDGTERITFDWTGTEGENAPRTFEVMEDGEKKIVEGRPQAIERKKGEKIFSFEIAYKDDLGNQQLAKTLPQNYSKDRADILNQYGVSWEQVLSDLDLLNKTPEQRKKSSGSTSASPSGKKVTESKSNLTPEKYTREKAETMKKKLGLKTDAELIKFAKDNDFDLTIE